MSRLLAILMCILGYSTSALYPQQYQWIKTGGTTQDLSTAPGAFDNEASYFTTTDPNGNVYSVNIVGNYPITADTFYRSAAYGANNNVLLTSYDCSGNMRWAKLIGSYTAPTVLGITADSTGHIYLCGVFPHGVLHIGYDTSIPSSSSHQVAAMMQFDTSGHYNWIRFIGPNTLANELASTIGAGTLAVDGQNNIHYLKFMKTGSQITPTVMSTIGNYDITYDVSGALLSAKRMQLDSTWAIVGAAIDPHSGKLYTFGYATAYAPASQSNYVASFDTSRNRIWMDSMRDITYPGAGGFSGVVMDNQQNLYLAGAGTGTIAYRANTVNNSLLWGGATSFVLKIDTLGNPYWMRGCAGNTGICSFNSLTLVPGNKVAVCGTMAGIITGDAITMSSYSGEGQNAFFSILDSSGHIQSIQQIHGNGFYDAGVTISSDRIGNLFVGGQFISNIWGGALSPITSIGGNSDFYVLKYGVNCSCTSMPIASFTFTGSPTVTFTYTGTVVGVDSVRWLFGDAGTSSSYSPSHTYAAAGTYTVRVTI